MRELHEWLGQPDPRDFPFDAVTHEFNCCGKQFVDGELLRLLDDVRVAAGGQPAQVRRFLDVVLDKYDGTFANQTYLALDLLDLPDPDDAQSAQRRRDRLHYLLVSDIAQFEAGDERGELEPDESVVAKRLHLTKRALAPVIARLDSLELSIAESRMLTMTMLPVTRMHDERLFIRAIQTYETTFALVAAHLHAALESLEAAASALMAAERSLAEAAPLFSLIATMQRDAFLAFREYTQGATAMQSPNYALVQARLSAVRELCPADSEVRSAETALRNRLQMWRQTHYRIAMRLLGDLPGTGATDGAAYLDRARSAA